MSENVQRTCSGCGQVDDHPHVIFNDWSGHHDCLPAAAVLALSTEDHPRARAFGFAVEQAHKGVRGEKLRDAIAEHHEKVTAPALAEIEGAS